MGLFLSHGLTLDVSPLGCKAGACVDKLLQDLSWVRSDEDVSEPALTLRLSHKNSGVEIPATARELFRADGFCGMEAGADFYLTDGSCSFRNSGATGDGDVFLSPSFLEKPLVVQCNFWAFALLKLLRNLGVFSLHAAGVVRNDQGVVITGSPGSGKSTLAIGLIRLGWRYLSDDALLLRDNSEKIEALAFRKNFYVNADAAAHYVDLPLGDEVPGLVWRHQAEVENRRSLPGTVCREM